MTTRTEYTVLDSPLGPVLVAWRGDAIASLRFGSVLSRTTPAPDWIRVDGRDNPVIRALRAYFGGRLREFDLEVDQPGTPFQQRVWREVATIPYGQTRSYGEIARAVGRPRAVRAVGAANGRNDVPIVVPCHRVVAADGSLHGYAAGREVKSALLSFEREGVWAPVLRLDL